MYGDDPDPPVYREAFPLIDLAEAEKRRRRLNAEIDWRNEKNNLVGGATVVWQSEFVLLIRYNIHGVWYLPNRVDNLKLTINWPIIGHHRRASATCAACGREAIKLYFASNDWLCAKCQGLGYRSSSLSRGASLTEQLRNLHYEIGEGRPDAMRHSEYLKKRDRLNDLYHELGTKRVAPGPRLRHFIYSHWRPDLDQ